MPEQATDQAAGAQIQQEHADLMEEGRRRPGVAEAIEVYEALQKHINKVSLQQGVRTMGYATGGNG